MTLPYLLGVETVIILQPVRITDRGTDLPDWTQSPASSTTVDGCSVQPEPGTESLGERQQSEIRLTAWIPGLPPITEQSAVTWRGVDYQVDGPPQRWIDPLERLTHTRVNLTHVRG